MASFPDGEYLCAEIRYMYPEGTWMQAGAAGATGHIVDGDLAYGVNENWFKKGPNGENVTWYWDSNYTNPIILGQNVDGYEINIYQNSMGFVLYGRVEQMNIKWQMGPKPSLENLTKNAGSVYFVKDPNRLSTETKSGFGELYYDDENGNRIKIGGTGISSLGFQVTSGSTNDEIQANLILEDGTSIRSGNFPIANFDGVEFQGGIVSTDDQAFYGLKSFTPGIICGTPMELNDGYPNSYFLNGAIWSENLSEDILNGSFTKNITNLGSMGSLHIGSGALGYVGQVAAVQSAASLDGYSDNLDTESILLGLWPLAIAQYIQTEEELELIDSFVEGMELPVAGWNMFLTDIGTSFLDITGCFELMSLFDLNKFNEAIAAVPTFIGNKFTARQIGLSAEMPIHQAFIRNLDVENINVANLASTNLTVDTLTIGANKPSINGTAFDGNSNITTNTWGYSRNFTIANAASATASAGTSVDGGSAVTLYIPSTMSGFTSISTATLLATTIGDTKNWTGDAYITTLKLKGTSTDIYHNIVSEATAVKTMTLDNASGYFAYAPLVNSTATAVGSSSRPVYVTAKGCITACDAISTQYGGTGLNTAPVGSLLVGADTTANNVITHNAMTTLAPAEKGSLLVSTGSAPAYIKPSLSISSSTGSELKVKFTTNIDHEITIPNASSSKAGIITTGEQTIAGAKTLSGALTAQQGITVSNGLTVSGTATFNNGITAKNGISLTGGSITHSGALTTSATNNLTVQAGSNYGLYLKGGLLVLDSSMYGTADPPTPTVEGQVYFKIVN